VDKATPLLPPVPEHPGCDSISAVSGTASLFLTAASAVVHVVSTPFVIMSVAIDEITLSSLAVVLDELIETGIVLDELIDEIGIVLDELIETGIVLDELIGGILPIVLRIFCAAISPQVTMPTAMPSASSSSFTSPASVSASVLVLSALYRSNSTC